MLTFNQSKRGFLCKWGGTLRVAAASWGLLSLVVLAACGPTKRPVPNLL